MKINPYLNFDGKAEEAMHFYQSVLGGEFDGGFHYFRDIQEFEIPESEKGKVMHVTLKIDDGVNIMASDTSPSMGHVWIKGNHNYVSLHPESKEDGERIFKGLSKGGKIEMEYQKTFWGS